LAIEPADASAAALAAPAADEAASAAAEAASADEAADMADESAAGVAGASVLLPQALRTNATAKALRASLVFIYRYPKIFKW
jgi:hypothetical protein